MKTTTRSKTIQVDILLRALGQDETDRILEKYNRARKGNKGALGHTEAEIAIAQAWINGTLDTKEAMRQLGIKTENGLYGKVGRIVKYGNAQK